MWSRFLNVELKPGRILFTAAVLNCCRDSLKILLLVLLSCAANAEQVQDENAPFRIFSWNISNNAFERDKSGFAAILRRADPDVVLLDEVSPAASMDELLGLLNEIRPASDRVWRINRGVSGGRQRGVIASHMSIEKLAEFGSVVSYPEPVMRYVTEAMSATERANPGLVMTNGIPVNGAIVIVNGKRLLVVIADLQCCGTTPDSWQDYRRRAEAQAIRDRVRQILRRTDVDGVIVAGDFNAVNTPIPLHILMGPYEPPHAALIPAVVFHVDGATSWTWDGRGTPFPSSALDYQLYGPQGLIVDDGLVIDSEDFSSAEHKKYGTDEQLSSRMSEHRPLVVEYSWRQ